MAPTICHIGEIGAVVRTGRIPHARHLFPRGLIDGREARVAVGPGMHFGNFQAAGQGHPLRIDLRAANYGDLSGETPQCVTMRDRAGIFERLVRDPLMKKSSAIMS